MQYVIQPISIELHQFFSSVIHTTQDDEEAKKTNYESKANISKKQNLRLVSILAKVAFSKFARAINLFVAEFSKLNRITSICDAHENMADRLTSLRGIK